MGIFRGVQGIISIGRGDVGDQGVVGNNFSGREKVSETEEKVTGDGRGVRGERRDINVEEAGQ